MADVLVVEDDSDLRQVIARALTRDGHRVTEAADGDEALALIRDGRAGDLVLTDLEMPGRTGLEVIRGSKAEPPERPVIAMSGKGRPVSVALDLARRCGADAVIAKPFKLSVLAELVNRVLAGEHPTDRETAEEHEDGDVVVIRPPNLLAAKLRTRAD